MTVRDVLGHIVAWKDSHAGARPARAFISAHDLEGMVVDWEPLASTEHGILVGYEALGVSAWYLDDALPSGTLRLEP